MTETYRDDCPLEFALSRRTLMAGGLLLTGAMIAPPLLNAQSTAAAGPAASPKFMELSTLLIDHHLDAGIGARLAAAMAKLNPAINAQIDQILDIAKTHNAKIVEDFFPAIPDGELKQTALAIISAWYMGVISDAPDAEVFAYELALMYRPTSDVMTLPSYAISGPNGWTADVPPLSDMPSF